jgi:hypothetical protein
MPANLNKKEKVGMMLSTIDSLLSGESSVELTQTTKGTTWKIKVYHPDPMKALEQANTLYDQCKQKYGEAPVDAS